MGACRLKREDDRAPGTPDSEPIDDAVNLLDLGPAEEPSQAPEGIEVCVEAKLPASDDGEMVMVRDASGNRRRVPRESLNKEAVPDHSRTVGSAKTRELIERHKLPPHLARQVATRQMSIQKAIRLAGPRAARARQKGLWRNPWFLLALAVGMFLAAVVLGFLLA